MRRRASPPAATALRRARAGAASVEFAIIAPAIVVLATVGYAGATLHAGAIALETGAAAAARWAILGETPAGSTRPAEIRRIVTDHVCPPAGGFCYWSSDWTTLDEEGIASPLRVEMSAHVDPRNLGRPEPFADANGNGRFDAGETFQDVNGNGRWDADMGRSDPGGSGDLVVYRLAFAQRVTHPLLAPALGSLHVHRAQVVVRNEPF